jgi:drug/metabolite transporter (DMT)-like permease
VTAFGLPERREPVAAAALDEGASSARLGICLVVGFTAAWAVLEEVLGSRFEGRYDLLQVVWCRYAVHVAILVAIWGWRKPGLLWHTRRPVFQLARSLLMFVMPFSFVAAVQSGEAVTSVWGIFWFAPLFTLALARLVLRERIEPSLWALATLGTVAAQVMLRPDLPATGMGWLLPLLMGLSFSLYVVMTRSLRFEAWQANLFYTAFGVLLFLSPFMPRVWTPFSMHDAAVFLGIGAIGLVALLALDRAVAMAPVAVSAPALHLQLVFVLLLGHRDSLSLLPPALVVASMVMLALVGCLYVVAGPIVARRRTTGEAAVVTASGPLPERSR